MSTAGPGDEGAGIGYVTQLNKRNQIPDPSCRGDGRKASSSPTPPTQAPVEAHETTETQEWGVGGAATRASRRLASSFYTREVKNSLFAYHYRLTASSPVAQEGSGRILPARVTHSSFVLVSGTFSVYLANNWYGTSIDQVYHKCYNQSITQVSPIPLQENT